MKLVHLVSMSILTSIKNIQFNTKLNGAHGATISRVLRMKDINNLCHINVKPTPPVQAGGHCRLWHELINNNYCKLLLFHATIPTLPVLGRVGLGVTLKPLEAFKFPTNPQLPPLCNNSSSLSTKPSSLGPSVLQTP